MDGIIQRLMDGYKPRLEDLRERIEGACLRAGRAADGVRLIAVTKNHPVEAVQALVELGVRDIGENRVREIVDKVPKLRGGFTVHMIGHLQTNKARKVWPLAGWIQSVDRDSIAEKLDALYEGGPKKNVLVEVNTSGEESKSGCRPEDCLRMCEIVSNSDAMALRGLMTIGPLHGGEQEVRSAFAQLKELSVKCCTEACGIASPELSMGMSNDFEWAIQEGATMVRLGTVLLGERVYR